MLPFTKDTPIEKNKPEATLSGYTHTLKKQANTKQQDGISGHLFYCEYVYRLFYVCE